MARNPDFDAVLQQMEAVHDAKNEDYASGSNPYSNFEGSAAISGQSVDKVFQTMIGIKMERLKQLVGTGKVPNHESVDDSILDLANYAALWLSYRRKKAGESIAREAIAQTEGTTVDTVDAWMDAYGTPY